MSDSWREAYSGLTEYVAGNPKVEIGKSVIAVPADVRPEFYRLFDTVRETFLKEGFLTLVNEAEALSKGYKEVRDEVAKLLRLDDISWSASLNWFLQEPTNGLIRVLFNPLFDLLKGKMDAAIFEQVASRNIENSFRDLYRSGYEKWVTLSLVKLLAPDKVFKVPLIDPDIAATQMEASVNPGSREETVPDPAETKSLTLTQGIMMIPFVFPDFIVRSAPANRYVSIRSGMIDALWTARLVSNKREWYYRSSLAKDYGKAVRWPDFMVYAGDKLEDLALIADFGRICRPDLIVECMEQKDWYQQEGLDRMRLHHDVLKPRMGTYIVSREPVPEQAYKELEPALEREQEPAPGEEPEKQEADIHILTVGLDQSQLEPIISVLMNEPGQWETAAVAQDS